MTADGLRDLRGRRVTVMGLGLFGGGVAVARHLVRAGADVLVTDLQDARALGESLAQLEGLPIRYRLGEHRDEDFVGVNLVVASPAVPPKAAHLARARAAGVPVTSELALFVRGCPAREVMAITGTNGKTSTTLLLGEMVRRARSSVFVGGNLGVPLLESLPSMGPESTVVLEVSSYQLEVLDAPVGWPTVSVVTCITPDHLDRHGSFEAYVAAKRRIVERQDAAGVTVLNRADPVVAAFADAARSTVRWFDGGPGGASEGVEYGWEIRSDAEWLVERIDGDRVPLAPTSAIRLPGAFQRSNALAAAAAARAIGVPPEAIRDALEAFRGAPHRLQELEPIGGIRVFDNAVSTVPESTITALEAIPGPIRWIAGGKSKGLDLSALARVAAQRARRLYAYGASAEALSKEVESAGGSAIVIQDLRSAFHRALAEARPGDTLLYSPAFASFDQYRNFTDRAAEFQRLVEAARGAAESARLEATDSVP